MMIDLIYTISNIIRTVCYSTNGIWICSDVFYNFHRVNWSLLLLLFCFLINIFFYFLHILLYTPTRSGPIINNQSKLANTFFQYYYTVYCIGNYYYLDNTSAISLLLSIQCIGYGISISSIWIIMVEWTLDGFLLGTESIIIYNICE